MIHLWHKLYHWGRVTHIWVSKIGSDNGLSPERRQAIIWTSVGMLLIGPLGTNFSEILIEIYTFSFTKMQWRHNGHDSVSNHQPHGCFLNRLFGRRSKKTSKLRVTGPLCGEFTGTGEFPTQRASNAENVSIWRRHHEYYVHSWQRREIVIISFAWHISRILY